MLAIETTDLKATTGPVYEKWGETARAGFQVVPDMLLKKMHLLDINPTELTVLLNILMHWWYREKKPFPRTTTIARRMGSKLRTVQHAIASLEEKKLIEREVGPNDETYVNPAPLVAKLAEFTKDDPEYLIRTRGPVT